MASPPPSKVTATKAADELPGRDTSLNIDQRMLLAMHRIGWIAKDGTAPQSMGGFAFVSVAAVKDKIREELVRVGVMVHVSFDGHDLDYYPDSKGRRWCLATVWGTLAFVNVDDPSQVIRNEIRAQGLDLADKAITKAMTAADKYGLLNALQIPTGDDPDASDAAPEPVRRTESAVPPPPEDIPPEWADEPPAAPTGGRCPRHDKAWTKGQYGWYCTSKESDPEYANKRGYCDQRPTKAWAEAQR